MASKWKYADLDANHRIGLLRKGNKELFDEEIARTKEIAKARREIGLDTTEQEKWLDTVGYNYNLSMADEGTKVSKTGYAQLYLGEKKADTEPSPVKKYREQAPKVTGYISAANRKIDNARKLAERSLAEKYEKMKNDARDELYDRYPHLKEQIINEGASPEGGKMKRAYDDIEQELAVIYEELDKELSERMSELWEKYAGFKDELMEYRKNGTAKESLGVIADVLIKNAAADDDFDYSHIPGIGKKIGVRALGGKADEAKLSEEVSEFLSRYPKKAERQDEAYEEDVTEEKTAEGITKEAAEFLGEKLKNVTGENRAIVGTIGEMLMRNGMNPDAAARLAAELLVLLVRNKAKIPVGM